MGEGGGCWENVLEITGNFLEVSGKFPGNLDRVR